MKCSINNDKSNLQLNKDTKAVKFLHIILAIYEQGDIILDPFAGLGTIEVATFDRTKGKL